MHMVLLKQFLNVINPAPSDKNKSNAEGAASKAAAVDDEEEDHLVVAVSKHIENKELVWPELIRLVL